MLARAFRHVQTRQLAWSDVLSREEVRPGVDRICEGKDVARVERREDLPAVLGIEGPVQRGLLARMRALLRS